MERDVIQRLRGFLKQNDFTATKLANAIGVNQTTITSKLNMSRGMDITTLCQILDYFPDLSAEWLLRGNSFPTLSAGKDTELQETCIEQAKEIMRLKKRIAELEHNF